MEEILDVSTRWKRMISFILRLFTLALSGWTTDYVWTQKW